MIKVGLTGGLGAGKSSACEVFASLGAPVIDADEICRELTVPDSPCFAAVRALFGNTVIDEAGALRRDRIRDIVFCDDTRRTQLEAILHPAVREKIKNVVATLRVPYCIVSIPLLIESNMQDLVDTIVVIDCPESLQIERATQRSGWSRATAQAVIEKQASRQTRLAAADIVIDNSGAQTALEKKITSLHEAFTQRGKVHPT